MICPVCFNRFKSDYYTKSKRKIYCSRKCKERVRAPRPSTTKPRREAALQALGAKCAICEIADINVLEVDHINNDGAWERKTVSRSRMLTQIIRGTKDRYQVLCRNCNYLKYLSYKESKNDS